jgi:chromate transporter
MIYITLFLEFFKIGLFSIGGGLATLPFLYELSNKYNWFNHNMLADMIAVSESTPGPIGVNIATFAGFHSSGLLGGIIATLGLITPSIIVIIIVAGFLEKFKNSQTVDSIFYRLRPAVTGLIAAAGFQVFKISILTLNTIPSIKNLFSLINHRAIILLVVLLFAIIKFKKHPIVYITSAAIIGIIFKI